MVKITRKMYSTCSCTHREEEDGMVKYTYFLICLFTVISQEQRQMLGKLGKDILQDVCGCSLCRVNIRLIFNSYVIFRDVMFNVDISTALGAISGAISEGSHFGSSQSLSCR